MEKKEQKLLNMENYGHHDAESGLESVSLANNWRLTNRIASESPPLDSRKRTSSRILAVRFMKTMMLLLLPTFVQSRLKCSINLKSSKKVHTTAWLDGMRGIASVLVFVHHVTLPSHDVSAAWSAEVPFNSVLRLPLIRFFYNGPFMVAIFFAVSGYALSFKPAKLMRQGDFETLCSTLSSSVFRRAFRIFLPCIASTSFIVLCVRLWLYEWTRPVATDPSRLSGGPEFHPERATTVMEQIRPWLHELTRFVNPFTNDDLKHYDGHLWTISTEYTNSIILFVTQLALCRLQPRFRLLSLLCLIGFAHQIAHWSLILFYGGFIFAELDIRRQPTTSRSGAKTRTNIIWSTTYIIVFLCGLYLGGQPETHLENAPGWNSLIAWIPEPFGGIFIRLRYWTMWGALLVVWSTSNSLILQRLFNHKVSQYLGKISFGFYLVHGCVIQTVGYLLFAFVWSITGYDTSAKKEAGFVSASIIIFAITIWVADIFTRLVDAPTLRFARWLERKCLMKHCPGGRDI